MSSHTAIQRTHSEHTYAQFARNLTRPRRCKDCMNFTHTFSLKNTLIWQCLHVHSTRQYRKWLANSHSNNSHQSTIRIWFENITILHKCSGNDNYTLGRDNDPKRRSRIILHATVCCSLPRHILPLQKQSTTPGLSPRKSVKHLYIKTLKNTTTFQLPYTQAFTIANPIKL